MKREDAIKQLKMDRDLCNFNPMTGEEEPINEDCRKSAEALDMAIKALEQEPCEDAVSRAEAINGLKKICDECDSEFCGDCRIDTEGTSLDSAKEMLKRLPPVTPTADVILIPEGATNGDVIKAMFPNCEQKENIHNGYFEMYFDGDFGNPSYMRVREYWWNAPYRKVEE